MRYFLAIFVLLVVCVLSIAGFRGSRTRRPPIEIVADMVRQPKLRPQVPDVFFADGRSSRLPVEGVVARTVPTEVGGRLVYPYEDVPFNTGRITGTTNFVELNPLPITTELLERGRQRFQLSCVPCHGEAGDGKGVTTKLGMTVIASLHDHQTRKLGQLPDGGIFDTITNGKNLMQGYGPNIAVADRWAIVAYVRVLQLSRLATVDDLSPTQRAALKK